MQVVQPAAHMMAAQPRLLRVQRPHPRLLHELAAKKNVSVRGANGSIYEGVCMLGKWTGLVWILYAPTISICASVSAYRTWK